VWSFAAQRHRTITAPQWCSATRQQRCQQRQ
jgi:hypothetical protein